MYLFQYIYKYRIKKKPMGEVRQAPPSLSAELKTSYGPQDLRRWPRESNEEREITKKMLMEAGTADATERVFYERRIKMHPEEIYFGLNLILAKSKEEGFLNEIFERKQFWMGVSQGMYLFR